MRYVSLYFGARWSSHKNKAELAQGQGEQGVDQELGRRAWKGMTVEVSASKPEASATWDSWKTGIT